ncbi:MAG: glycine/sarcosine/betaine reductase selenoprotein B family protein [Desulfobacterales bacterium]
MGDLSEFTLKYKLFLKAYPWRRIEPVPWVPLKKPLKDSRAAVVCSAGLVQPGQEPFDDSMRGGDCSFREIPADTDLSALIDTHRSDLYDHSGLRQDPNLVFPLVRLQELVRGGRIGSLNHRHLSFMGSLTALGRLRKKTAPAAVRKLVEDGVDIALLVPV